jgi:hypothetical protein
MNLVNLIVGELIALAVMVVMFLLLKSHGIATDRAVLMSVLVFLLLSLVHINNCRCAKSEDFTPEGETNVSCKKLFSVYKCDELEPAPVMPVEPTPVMPVEPTPVMPVEPTPVMPVEPTPVMPVEPNPAAPSPNVDVEEQTPPINEVGALYKRVNWYKR